MESDWSLEVDDELVQPDLILEEQLRIVYTILMRLSLINQEFADAVRELVFNQQNRLQSGFEIRFEHGDVSQVKAHLFIFLLSDERCPDRQIFILRVGQAEHESGALQNEIVEVETELSDFCLVFAHLDH